MSNTAQNLLLGAATALVLAGNAAAQDVLPEDEVIVTGVVKATTEFDSSASVTALSSDEINNLAPRSVSELFRALPGVKSENTGGDANANIKVRGLPIASGGSRYFSIQENGFPTLLIGDTAFATADSFVRVDNTIGSVQSIRGGSSATQAPNAAGGIVNLISKRPTENAGSIAATVGLDYDSYRVDAEYGGVFGDDAYYHIGGFARTGEGVRDVEGSQEEGFQLKATLGKRFDRGNVAVHLKALNDRVPTYLPLPMRIGADGEPESIGLDLGSGTNSLGLTDFAVRRDGNVESYEEGFEAEMYSIGVEGDYEINEIFSVGGKARYADISGNFYSPFPFSVSESDTAGEENIEFALFNTESPDLSNLFGDVYVDGGFDNVSVRLGLFYADQASEQTWNFNQARAVLRGDELVTSGTEFTNPEDGSYIDGFRAGNPAFGFCCTRVYDFDIENFAPYAALNLDFDQLSVEASYRRNNYDITGQFVESSIVGPRDLNGDGTIATNEQEVQTPDLANLRSVDYSANFDSFSVGANYQFNDTVAVFANYSEGASVTSPDRSTGSLQPTAQAGLFSGIDDQFLNFVDQFELGMKTRILGGNVALVYFNADVAEAGQFEVTTQNVIQNTYDTDGFELEVDIPISEGFGLIGNATYTNADISGPANNANLGNTPRRQSDFVFNLNPYYAADRYDVGLNVFSTTSAPAQDSNLYDLPGYTTVGAYVNVKATDAISLSLAANNLFDADGFTEAEGDGFASGDLVRFRPINGRTVSATLRYDF